ncbi:hypothetical protein [Maribacter sp. MAR_2009_72]|uniref:hypothetical protein n=1 Tax=Maribacter sp. MAR_2009_72 TaxID=1250050 RepID=UPI0011995D01|nr:hypothetical protein [Maribacter sp. MAR_2009_72]TVZ17257.1 hypothetical protein JM81_3535 [Maribacter sp. MAR_2009_72]
MKTLFTLLIILFAGGVALAQNAKQNDKVDTLEMGIVMVGSISDSDLEEKVTVSDETSIARLYRYKNSRVNRELAFITKKNYGKLA